jgi:hypothetical protein
MAREDPTSPARPRNRILHHRLCRPSSAPYLDPTHSRAGWRRRFFGRRPHRSSGEAVPPGFAPSTRRRKIVLVLRRRPRPRILPSGVLEYWSIGVLRFPRITPRLTAWLEVLSGRIALNAGLILAPLRGRRPFEPTLTRMRGCGGRQGSTGSEPASQARQRPMQ